MDYNTIMSLWFYDFQNIIETYQRILEKRKEEEKKQAKQEGYDPDKFSPDGMMKQVTNSMPKMPTINIPKL